MYEKALFKGPIKLIRSKIVSCSNCLERRKVGSIAVKVPKVALFR